MSEIENHVARALGVKPDCWMVKAAIGAVLGATPESIAAYEKRMRQIIASAPSKP